MVPVNPPKKGCQMGSRYIHTWMSLEGNKNNPKLGGGTSNLFYFHPEPWGDDPIWLLFFKWVGSTTNYQYNEMSRSRWVLITATWLLRCSWRIDWHCHFSALHGETRGLNGWMGWEENKWRKFSRWYRYQIPFGALKKIEGSWYDLVDFY